MRRLKYHEQKLLKKVNLEEWKKTNTTKEQLVTTKYVLTDRNTYHIYNKIVGKIRKLTESLAALDNTNVTKKYLSNKLLNKLFDIGIISEKKMTECIKITVSDFCKRRLPIVITHKKFVENYQDADKFVQHGHFKIGTNICRDSNVLISRAMEEFIKWNDNSKIKKKLDEVYSDYDDFKYN